MKLSYYKDFDSEPLTLLKFTFDSNFVFRPQEYLLSERKLDMYDSEADYVILEATVMGIMEYLKNKVFNQNDLESYTKHFVNSLRFEL